MVKRTVSTYKNAILASTTLTMGLFALSFQPAHAVGLTETPQGGQYVAGLGGIDDSVVGSTVVTQTTDKGVIEWQSFNVGENASVNFIQPSNSSITVNRVVGAGTDPSQILGQLGANGNVAILDSNGVIFGQNATVNVGGIIASTGEISNSDVMDGGKLTIDSADTGEVINEGSITVTDSGLAAFVAPHVENSGVIQAKLGSVSLAAGEKATVDLYGDGLVEIAADSDLQRGVVENSGTIRAQGGKVMITAQAAKGAVDSVINLEGLIDVSSASSVGGLITVKGADQNVDVNVNGSLSASGQTGGGEITIESEDITISSHSVLAADAVENGDGGNIALNAAENGYFSGIYLARGGETSGNGGFIEASAKEKFRFDALAATYAENGTHGSLSLDADQILIHSGFLNDTLGATSYISEETLAKNLLLNGEISVQADEKIDVGTEFGLSAGSFELIGDDNVEVSTSDFFSLVSSIFFLNSFTADINPVKPIVVTPSSSAPFAPNATAGNLVFNADEVNFNTDLLIGSGSVNVIADAINLDGVISGTDGVTETVLDDTKLSTTADTVNVISNDALIQQGIDFVNAGATVNVGVGAFSEQLFINKNLNLVGSGINSTTLVMSPTTLNRSGVSPHGANNYAIVQVFGAEKVNISGFLIDGSTNAQDAFFDDYDRFMGVSYLNAGGIFENNRITGIASKFNTDRTGFAFHASSTQWPGDHIVVRDNIIDDFQKFGITTVDLRLKADIENNVIVGKGQNTKLDQVGILNGWDAKTSIENNTILFTETGIKNFQASGTKIADNTLSNVRNGAVIENSRSVVLSDNSFTGESKGLGIEIINSRNTGIYGGTVADFRHGIAASDSDNLIIQSVALTGNERVNIQVTDSDNALIGGSNSSEGNLITGGSHGVRLNTVSNSIVSFNTIDGTGGADNFRGVLDIDGTDNTIANNAIGNAGTTKAAAGVIANGSTGTEISGNTISNSGGKAVTISGSVDVLANENVLVDNWAGFWIRNSENVSVEENYVDGTTSRQGLRAKNVINLEVRDNTFNNTANDAIQLGQVTGANIEDNFIGYTEDSLGNRTLGAPNSIQGEGVDINNSTGVTLTNNQIDNTTGPATSNN